MIYADHNSTSPIAPSVTTAMQPFLSEEYGNPSSSNYLGKNARKAVEKARSQVASLLTAKPEEVVFMSGGTESSAHALIGAVAARVKQDAGNRKLILRSIVEHPCVIEPISFLEDFVGVESEVIAVDQNGQIDLDSLQKSLAKGAAILSVMLANNETGVLFPVEEIAKMAKKSGCLFHCDAVQAAGKLPLDLTRLGVDLLSISAHKFGGPKGIGALIIREGSLWQAVVRGGSQESGRRGGTEAVALIVGMGEAARIRQQGASTGTLDQVRHLRDSFEQSLLTELSGCSINGASTVRLGNTSSVVIENTLAQNLIAKLANYNICVSAGSACKSGTDAPSHVLQAMGLSSTQCFSTIRVSFGPSNTKEEVSTLVKQLCSAVKEDRRELETQSKSLMKNLG